MGDKVDTVKIILSASKIPLGSVVTKTKGTARYILRRQLVVFPVDPGKKGREARVARNESAPPVQSIKAEPGVLFLVGFDHNNAGKANAVPATKELIWHAHPRSVVSVLQRDDYDDWTLCPTCGHDIDEA